MRQFQARMRLIVDASTLVAEVLRVRGRALLTHGSLDLLTATETWGETEYELQKRVAQFVRYGHLNGSAAEELLNEALDAVAARVTQVPRDTYAARIEEARRRIPRDFNDAPAVALALILNCGIWTGDRDFFGCGLPVWTIETLQLHLEYNFQVEGS